MVAVVKHFLDPGARKKRLQKMTKGYYWTDVKENIGTFSKT